MQNKLSFSIVIILCSLQLSAKKIKFAVDMTGQAISPNGIHVAGDFQTAAGYAGGDWNPGTTPMTKEGSTQVYSVVVDVPAFKKYEYKFVNGDLFYESEIIDVKSRVGYDFNDNRWIYVDSLSTDTVKPGNILFGLNAPAGKKMVRFIVDMQLNTVSNAGVHISGDFNAWNYKTNILYSFGNKVFEVIQFVDGGSNTYKFSNGILSSDAETVPSNCAISGNRMINVNSDTILSVVCFSSCSACNSGSVNSYDKKSAVQVFPNPSANGEVELNLESGVNNVNIFDVSGKLIQTYPSHDKRLLKISGLRSGLYLISNYNIQSGNTKNLKLLVQ